MARVYALQGTKGRGGRKAYEGSLAAFGMTTKGKGVRGISWSPG